MLPVGLAVFRSHSLAAAFRLWALTFGSHSSKELEEGHDGKGFRLIYV